MKAYRTYKHSRDITEELSWYFLYQVEVHVFWVTTTEYFMLFGTLSSAKSKYHIMFLLRLHNSSSHYWSLCVLYVVGNSIILIRLKSISNILHFTRLTKFASKVLQNIWAWEYIFQVLLGSVTWTMFKVICDISTCMYRLISGSCLLSLYWSRWSRL